MPKNSEKRGRGRPRFNPTPAQRRDVSIAAGGGMRHEDIAISLGISRETLEKYFEAELSTVAAMRRVEALKGLHKAAKRGSSSAAKAYLAADPQVAAPPAPREQKPEDEPKLGKKEQAAVDATTAQDGTAWADLLPRGTAPH